jgi:hypothetical protein
VTTTSTAVPTTTICATVISSTAVPTTAAPATTLVPDTRPCRLDQSESPSYSDGTVVSDLDHTLSPNGEVWEWEECASECATTEACEFWVMDESPVHNTCRLRANRDSDMLVTSSTTTFSIGSSRALCATCQLSSFSTLSIFCVSLMIDHGLLFVAITTQ